MRRMAKSPSPPSPNRIPPCVVIFGDEEYQKIGALRSALNDLLPPDVDRSMALCEYDGTRNEEDGGPTLARVMDDLATLPFLADRRVVVVQEADKFISAWRERLENYLAKPHHSATLVLVCRSFMKTTRLYKAAASVGRIHECKKLTGRALVEFVQSEFARLGKRAAPNVAPRLVELIGGEQGVLAGEVEKLTLYALDRPSVTEQDVDELVGLSREEKVFAVMDMAALGRLPQALTLWQNVLATDPAAAFRALGGITFVLRRWLTAHELVAEGQGVRAIAPRVMMWGREAELEQILRRLPVGVVRRLLAAVAELDSQVKTGGRSIEAGVEALLLRLSAPAA